jgi:hypothetical protein
MYKFYNIRQLESNAQDATIGAIDRHGVSVYVNTNPDDVSPDFIIDPTDIKGIAIFREFAAKMAEHYKTLNNEQPTEQKESR